MPMNFLNQPYIETANGKESAESQGWKRSIVIRGIFGKEKFFKSVNGRKSLSGMKMFEAWTYREYEIKPYTCKHCQQQIDAGKLKQSVDYFKMVSLKTPCFQRCFLGVYGAFGKGDLTMLKFDWDNDKSWVLKKEEPLTTDQVIERFMEGGIDFICDYGLIRLLENKLDTTF